MNSISIIKERSQPPYGARGHGTWTKQDKEELFEVITTYFETYGKYDWDVIAKKVDRTPFICEYKWTRVLNPEIKRGRWSRKEDDKLIKRVKKYKDDWHRIAKKMDGRNFDQCRERYALHLDPYIKIGNWTKKEDNALVKAISNIGAGHWKTIAEYIPQRTSKQCRDRWTQIGKDFKKDSECSERSSIEYKGKVDEDSECSEYIPTDDEKSISSELEKAPKEKTLKRARPSESSSEETYHPPKRIRIAFNRDVDRDVECAKTLAGLFFKEL